MKRINKTSPLQAWQDPHDAAMLQESDTKHHQMKVRAITGIISYSRFTFGSLFLSRLSVLARLPSEPLPRDESETWDSPGESRFVLFFRWLLQLTAWWCLMKKVCSSLPRLQFWDTFGLIVFALCGSCWISQVPAGNLFEPDDHLHLTSPAGPR